MLNLGIKQNKKTMTPSMCKLMQLHVVKIKKNDYQTRWYNLVSYNV